MTNLIDSYLLKSGMPKEELCDINRNRRDFYYYGMIGMAVLGLCLLGVGLFNIIG